MPALTLSPACSPASRQMFNGTPLHGRNISVKLDDFIQQAAGLAARAEEHQQQPQQEEQEAQQPQE
jgi:hypothetical protein